MLLLLTVDHLNAHVHVVDLLLLPSIEVLDVTEGQEQKHLDHFIFDYLSGEGRVGRDAEFGGVDTFGGHVGSDTFALLALGHYLVQLVQRERRIERNGVFNPNEELDNRISVVVNSHR